MSYFLRAATPADARRMADLAGPPVTAADLAGWMTDGTEGAAWHLVEDDRGGLYGFQQIGPDARLPTGACAIATFLAPQPLPPGAAAALFEATAATARRIGYVWISAEIAEGNDPARIYYQNRGFRPYSGGNHRIGMRFDLD